ncbi:prepilin-type N-terminal cleavage/methylation domain-containing protein [Teredinibacter haidensis]|uniref:prepilin-type N-terminal cleavage/methylation domain-containing protein n=1 Tax=Teredinibacter haidensis TaxID=2731755 RepID=UPI0009491481|nr:prepilin-type N-terminal cleavage/methylation domain-containing protein [Teredinibacter haidensis]
MKPCCRQWWSARLLSQQGFSLFELCIVLMVIGILIYFSYGYYRSTIEDSKAVMVKFQAATFSRTVSNLYGQAKLTGADSVTMEGTEIFINEKGWPASAEERSSVRSYNQSPKECELLWHGIFSNAPGTVIAGSKDDENGKPHNEFRIYSINGRICRYELRRKPKGQYYFDYHLGSGKVEVFSP